MTTNIRRVQLQPPDPERDAEDEENEDEFDQFDMTSPLMTSKEEPKQERTWNIFRNPPKKKRVRAYEDWGFYQNFIRFMKILTYAIVFILVLSTSMLALSVFLLMTSQLEQNANRTVCASFGQQESTQIPQEERIKWTWGLFICLIIPEIGTLIRSLRKVFKVEVNHKKTSHPTIIEFVVPCIFEVLHAIGLGLLTFNVLPSENVVRGVLLTNCACLIPGVLCLFSRFVSKSRFWLPLMTVDAIAILALLYALIRWPTAAETDQPWVLPLGAILTSLGWWENYLPADFNSGLTGYLGDFKKRLEITRYYSYLFISLIKMAVLFLTLCLSTWITGDALRPYFSAAMFSSTRLYVITDAGFYEPETNSDAIINSILIQVFAAYLCYICAKYACKISIERFSFALPLLLSVPLTATALWGMCDQRESDSCYSSSIFPDYLYWNCPVSFDTDFTSTPEFGWIGLILLFCQGWIAWHIWFPKWDPLAATEALFTVPMYPAILTGQSLMMNRKPDDGEVSKIFEQPGNAQIKEKRSTTDGPFSMTDERSDRTPKIIACATLWHEEKEEMIAMLKSVFRMDLDNWQRKYVSKNPEDERLVGYYEYTTHIFFDDAFKREYKAWDDFTFIINEHVVRSIGAIEEACAQVHGEEIQVSPPKRIPTPYGGRLEWTLPGETKLIVHLKNKDKIRHRKRWSQVMYMYYLLGHLIAESGLPHERQQVIAENTFLLALDGDIDFQPHSVELLLNLMKKNDHLGAACGRIHPIGNGPMVWYQKFEYAVGHWLQKATEHMIGCVLCSPGCFSMFRAKALMDDSVMAKYTTLSEEPRHYVQYDQGEDRWLCTLLLQKGWRVEYCAASDSYTHAPEGFDEFFNQRRRWVPSTMANIMDLLMDSKETTENNQNISMPYIFYQWILFIGGVLGPGTIFLMVVGSVSVAFNFSNETSFILNLVPILLFIITCYFCKASTQLALAKLLSAIYVFVMIAVLVALILQIGEDGLLAPSSMFLLAVSVSFIVAAIIHPLEFTCLIHGILYYITIPSMYLLLIIYSLFNLHDVSWGTRENPVAAAPTNPDAVVAGKKAGKKGGIISGLKGIVGMEGSDESLDLSTAGLCRMSCCFSTKPKDEEETVSLIQMQRSLESLIEHVGLDKKKLKEKEPERKRSVRLEVPINRKRKESSHSNDSDDSDSFNNDKDNPDWLHHKRLNEAEAQTGFLMEFETQFWEQLIKNYLEPIDEDENKKKQLKKALKELRNKVMGAFFMFNAIFVTAMFLLQLHKDDLYIVWPFGGTFTMVFNEVDTSVAVEDDYLHLEPLGVLFILFYAIVMLVQFLAMFCHRLATFSLIMVSTSILRGDENKDLLTRPSASKAKATVKELREIQNRDLGKTKVGQDGRTVRGANLTNLHKSRNERAPTRTLNQNFANKCETLKNSPDQMNDMRKYVKDPAATIKRLSSILQLRQTTNLETQA